MRRNAPNLNTMINAIDIGFNKTYPGSMLSNFAANSFVFEDVACASMEGLLQSFKFPNTNTQILVCSMVGHSAKLAGFKQHWQKKQELYWNGIIYKRHSNDYQQLLTRAFECLNSNARFKAALSATRDSKLVHTIGKNDPYKTILTEEEFCWQLESLRKVNQHDINIIHEL